MYLSRDHHEFSGRWGGCSTRIERLGTSLQRRHSGAIRFGFSQSNGNWFGRDRTLSILTYRSPLQSRETHLAFTPTMFTASHPWYHPISITVGRWTTKEQPRSVYQDAVSSSTTSNLSTRIWQYGSSDVRVSGRKWSQQ